jgi:hypothetical protein
MFEALSVFLLAPVVAAYTLLTISWWIGGGFFCLFLWSTYLVHSDERSDALGFAAFLGGVVLAVFAGNYFGTETSLWEAVKLTFAAVASGIGQYAMWGVLVMPFLWIFQGLEFRRKYRQATEKFKSVSFVDSATEQNKDKAWKECLHDAGLRKDTPIDARSKEGVQMIASYFFAWPLHLADRAFGEFIRQIPELLSVMFGGLLNRLTKVVTGGAEGRPA